MNQIIDKPQKVTQNFFFVFMHYCSYEWEIYTMLSPGSFIHHRLQDFTVIPVFPTLCCILLSPLPIFICGILFKLPIIFFDTLYHMSFSFNISRSCTLRREFCLSIWPRHCSFILLFTESTFSESLSVSFICFLWVFVRLCVVYNILSNIL